jgi:hypothetical protein
MHSNSSNNYPYKTSITQWLRLFFLAQGISNAGAQYTVVQNPLGDHGECPSINWWDGLPTDSTIFATQIAMLEMAPLYHQRKAPYFHRTCALDHPASNEEHEIYSQHGLPLRLPIPQEPLRSQIKNMQINTIGTASP